MNPKLTCILLIIVAGLVVFSGCTGSTGSVPKTTIMSPDPITPVKSPTPIPSFSTSEIARIRVDHFGMNPSTETIYEFVGTVMVNNGVYQSVQVILRYPDSQEYTYDAGSMGGSYPAAKAFSLFPSDQYKGINPEKIIVLDGEQYPTVYRYENGVLSWVATAADHVSP